MPHTRPDEPIIVDGMPADLSDRAAAVARSRLLRIYSDLAAETRQPDLVLTVARHRVRPTAHRVQGPVAPHQRPAGDDEPTLAERAARYVAESPRFTFDQLVIPPHLRESLITAVDALRLRSKVYDEWGLRAIEPTPSAALNLHGPPGTGKSLAAHAIATRLGMPILMAGYAELESKFHGDGPKNVKAAFQAAQKQGALLFVDEADSLLSRRLTNVTQGSDQAINSMRSQIVLCLDQFEGVVVFATNLVTNYDSAFESRVRHFHFTLPDRDARHEIWRTMLVPSLPLAPDVDVDTLVGPTEGFSGREIKLTVIMAAERAAIAGGHLVCMADFLFGVEQIVASRAAVAEGRPATADEQATIERHLAEQGLIEHRPPDGIEQSGAEPELIQPS